MTRKAVDDHIVPKLKTLRNEINSLNMSKIKLIKHEYKCLLRFFMMSRCIGLMLWSQ